MANARVTDVTVLSAGVDVALRGSSGEKVSLIESEQPRLTGGLMDPHLVGSDVASTYSRPSHPCYTSSPTAKTWCFDRHPHYAPPYITKVT